MGMGGLAWLGGILNKPGRVIRGALGGQPRELLNVIPFSDAMRITDPTQEVRGQDLIGASPDTPFFSPEGLAGFGVDVLLDPLTYTGFGAVGSATRLGKTANKLGVMPKTGAGRAAGVAAGSMEADTLARAVANVPTGPVPASAVAQVANKPLGGHIGFGLPFGMSDTLPFNLEPLGQALSTIGGATVGKIPGVQGALQAGRTVGAPIGRALKGLVQPQMMGQFSEVGQEVAPRLFGAAQQGEEAAKGVIANIAREAGVDMLKSGQELRNLVEQPGLVASTPQLQRAADMIRTE
jgi:hypothetical protein